MAQGFFVLKRLLIFLLQEKIFSKPPNNRNSSSKNKFLTAHFSIVFG
jgi:hypothetical protein